MRNQQTSVGKTEELTAPPAAMAGFGVAFRPFLQSELWEEQNGMPLSILSALARLDLDPWEEAETLALLPRDMAARRLLELVQGLPGAPANAETLCDPPCVKALGLLPKSQAAAGSEGLQIAIDRSWRRWILILELAYVGSMLAYYAFTLSQLPTAHVDAAKPGPAAAVSPHPRPPRFR